MRWHSHIDPETNQVMTGLRTIVTTVIAVMIIAFADDIKSLAIDAETSGLMEVNSRQNIEEIAESVTAHERTLASYNTRILRLEFSNKDHSRLQGQISSNTNLIRKIQNTQIRIVERVNNINSKNKTLESRIRVLERE